MKLRASVVATAISAALISSPTWGREQLRDYALQAASPESIVLLQSERLPFADYEIVFQQEGKRNILTGGPSIFVLSQNSTPYVGRKFKPGTYVLTMIVQQRHWGTCFSNTIAFTLEPGKIYLLGTFNSRAVLEELQKSALERGKGRLARGSNALDYNPTIEPEFTSASVAQLDDARRWIANTMPRTSAAVEPLSTSRHSRSSSGTAKAMQVCG